MDPEGGNIHTRKRLKFGEYGDTWIIECACTVGSVLALGGLCLLLALFDGHKTFEYKGVTINSIISLLATCCRLTLMAALAEAISQTKWVHFKQSQQKLYDFEDISKASRSTLGRAVYLWTRPLSIATVGVIAALLCLGFDFFAQQLIRFVPGYVSADELTSYSYIPYTQRYYDGTVLAADVPAAVTTCNSTTVWDYDDFLPPQTVADYSMQAGILEGLTPPEKDYSGNKPDDYDKLAQLLPFGCNTGNCTYSTFDSLAVCNTCVNITDQLVRYQTYATAIWQQYTRLNQSSFKENVTGYRLPNGAYLDNANNWTAGLPAGLYNDDYSNITAGTFLSTLSTQSPNDTISFKDMDTLILATSVIIVDEWNYWSTWDDNTTWPSIPVLAYECALSWCVNSYESQVINGSLYENVTQKTDYKRNAASWQPQNVASNNIVLNSTQIESIVWDECVSSVNRSDLQLVNSTGGAFNISYKAVNSISSFMADTFIYDEDMGILLDNKTTLVTTAAYFETPSGLEWYPDSIQPIFNLVTVQVLNISAIFDTLAESMSNAVRSSVQSGYYLQGTSQVAVNIIEVQWQWISLPALVVLLAAIQLAVTMYHTRKFEVPIWKSSSLALLSKGETMAPLLVGAEKLSTMEHVAKTEHVDLFAAGSPSGGSRTNTGFDEKAPYSTVQEVK